MPDARAHAPATSCLPARRWRHPRAPRTPLDPLHLSPLSRVSPSVPIPSALSLSRSTTSTREHRRAPPQPVSTPSLTDAPGSSAGPPSTSSTSHEAPDVPQHRPRCLLQPRDRRPSSSNSPAPDRPRPRRASPRHRRESLTLSPNSACSPPCRSAVPHEHRSHRPPLLLHA